jgi:hypothetical protein
MDEIATGELPMTFDPSEVLEQTVQNTSMTFLPLTIMFSVTWTISKTAVIRPWNTGYNSGRYQAMISQTWRRRSP